MSSKSRYASSWIRGTSPSKTLFSKLEQDVADRTSEASVDIFAEYTVLRHYRGIGHGYFPSASNGLRIVSPSSCCPCCISSVYRMLQPLSSALATCSAS